MRRFLVVLAALLVATAAGAYVRTTVQPGGLPLFRNDIANVRWLVNNQTAAGLTGTTGVIITADSDPQAALRAAIASWNSISTSSIHFADLQTTALTDIGADNESVIIFTDTPEHRSITGTALALTMIRFNATGQMLDTDIIFNPATAFSTNLTPGTFDIEATTAHEMGHAIGLGHTNLLGATMFPRGPSASNFQARLSADEIAFANAVYPGPGQAANFGTISGAVRTSGGDIVPGAFVTAVNFDTLIHVSALTDINNGLYFIRGLPPGDYGIYVEPVDGPLFPGDLSLSDPSVDANFRPAVLGGLANPTPTAVTAGNTTQRDLVVQSGQSTIDFDVVGNGPVGQDGNGTVGSSARRLTAGQSVDLLLWGPGLANTITANNIAIAVPRVDIIPNSVHVDPLWTINGRNAVRFTVEVGADAPNSVGSVLIEKNGELAVFSGGIFVRGVTLTPSFIASNLRNAASGLGGAMAPESWVDLYGEDLATRFVIDENLPANLDGTTVTIIDSGGIVRDARVRFLADNVFGTIDRIQFLMPDTSNYGPATLRVRNGAGGQGEAVIQIGPVGPGLFAANENGQGPAAAVYQLFNNVPAQISAGITFTPVAVGGRQNLLLPFGAQTDGLYVSFYGTGFRRNTSFTCVVSGLGVPVIGAVAQGQFLGLDQAVCGPFPRSLAGRQNANAVLTFNGVPANVVSLSFQ